MTKNYLIVADEDFVDVIQTRAHHLFAMDSNVFTKASAAVTAEVLSASLDGAHIAGASDFGAFSIEFGFVKDGRDFIVVRNADSEGLHFLALDSNNQQGAL